MVDSCLGEFIDSSFNFQMKSGFGILRDPQGEFHCLRASIIGAGTVIFFIINQVSLKRNKKPVLFCAVYWIDRKTIRCEGLPDNF